MNKKKLIIIILIPILLYLIYILGPQVPQPQLSSSPAKDFQNFGTIKNYISKINQHENGVRKGCEAEIIWNNNEKNVKTPYSLVYLHGYSACKEEGTPVHVNLAKRYGMNLFLARLYGHGVKGSDTFNQMNADSLIMTAKKAIVIGRMIGEKVILLSTSTGGTLSMFLSPKDKDVAAQILLSPNIKIYNESTQILDDPWGLTLGRLVNGGDEIERSNVTAYKLNYWASDWKMTVVAVLESLVTYVITDELFAQTKKPLFLSYYYKNEDESDHTVSVAAMKKMFEKISTSPQQKKQFPLPNANHHVIGNAQLSNPKSVNQLLNAIYQWIESVLKISKKNSDIESE